MGKLLSWVVLIALAWFVIHLVRLSQRRRERSRSEPASASAARASSSRARGRTFSGEPIVACAHCGLFVPQSDVVRDGERVYCSAAHRDADRATRRAAAGDAQCDAEGRSRSAGR